MFLYIDIKLINFLVDKNLSFLAVTVLRHLKFGQTWRLIAFLSTIRFYKNAKKMAVIFALLILMFSKLIRKKTIIHLLHVSCILFYILYILAFDCLVSALIYLIQCKCKGKQKCFNFFMTGILFTKRLSQDGTLTECTVLWELTILSRCTQHKCFVYYLFFTSHDDMCV